MEQRRLIWRGMFCLLSLSLAVGLAVPALAFKRHALFAAAPDQIVRTFRSSGTTEPAPAPVDF